MPWDTCGGHHGVLGIKLGSPLPLSYLTGSEDFENSYV